MAATVYSDIFVPYLVRLTTAGSPVVLDGITAQEIDPGNKREHRVGASQRYPRLATLAQAARMVRVTTISLDTLLGVSGIMFNSVPVGSGLTYTAVNVHEAKMASGGHFAAGSVHRTNVIANGQVTLQALRCEQGIDGRISPASADIDILPVSDGTNDPLAVSVSQALATAGAETGYFALGPVVIHGTEEALVTGWTYGPNIIRGESRAAGQKYPRMAFDRAARPLFDIALRSPVPIATYGLDGGAIDTTVVFYLVKCDPSGARVAAATAEHISITVNHGTLTPTRVAGALGGDVAGGLQLAVLDDGVNSPVIVSTAATLP